VDTYVQLSSDGINLIAGWSLEPTMIAKGPVSMSYADEAFIVNNGTTAHRVIMGKLAGKFGTSAGAYGFILGDGTGETSADTLVELSNERNMIAGWTITSSQIYKGDLVIDSSLGTIRTATNFTTGDGFFLSGSAENNFRVGIAGGQRLQFTGTNVEIYNSGNQKLVSLGATNEIAGWGISTTAISSSGQEIVISSGDKRITINDGSQDRIWLGEVDGGTTYGMKIFDGVGQADADRLVELGEGDNMIAGWALTSGSLSNTNARLYSVGILSLGSANA
jgi:hypothetical protein